MTNIPTYTCRAYTHKHTYTCRNIHTRVAHTHTYTQFPPPQIPANFPFCHHLALLPSSHPPLLSIHKHPTLSIPSHFTRLLSFPLPRFSLSLLYRLSPLQTAYHSDFSRCESGRNSCHVTSSAAASRRLSHFSYFSEIPFDYFSVFSYFSQFSFDYFSVSLISLFFFIIFPFLLFLLVSF